MSVLGKMGHNAIEGFGQLLRTCAMLWAVVWLALLPATWRRTVRDVLARQVFFSGIQALPFTALVALLVGLSVVVQAQEGWASSTGLGNLLIRVILREVAPLVTCFIVMARSGTAIATELANMQVGGEVKTLDAQGIEPMVYLVVPRVVGATLSVCCLTVVFAAVAVSVGYVSGQFLHHGMPRVDPVSFLDGILRSLRPTDVLSMAAKTVLTGMTTGTVCCIEGLSVHGRVTEVPQAAARAVVRSIGALFFLTALISILTLLWQGGPL